MASSRWRHAVVTHSGMRREHNEDALLELPDVGVWMVADGMGGHDAGEVASQIACETVQSALATGASLASALNTAHEAILNHAAQAPSTQSMGTTAVLLRLLDSAFEIAWVGDSRAYVFNHTLQPLTRDHSFVEMLQSRGLIDAEQARKHPQRSVITQALGVECDRLLEIGTAHGLLARGALLLLCSDGLTEVLSDTEIAALLAQHRDDLEQASAALLAAVLAGGGPDNVSLVLVQQVASDAPAEPDQKPAKPTTASLR